MPRENIFIESFPLVASNDELEIVKAKFPQYEDAYVATGCIKERREWVEKLWERYEPYADENFLVEIRGKGKFNERSWEMYLGSTFQSKGLVLNKKSPEGPDLHLTLGGVSVYVEATAPGLGEVDPAPEKPELIPGVPHIGGGDIEGVNRPLILRLTAAVSNKRVEYQKNIKKGLIKDSDPFIIAINGYTFLGIVADSDYLMRRTFFAAGCVSYPRLPTGSFGKPFFQYKPTVEKRTPQGIVQVPTDIFTNESYAEVSAILFSPDHIVATVRDLKTLGGDIVLVRNPFARNKLPNGFPAFGRECVLDGNKIYYI